MANQSQNQENQNQQGQIGQQLQSRLSNLNPEQRTILNWCVQAWNQSNPNAAFSNIASTILHDQIDMNNSQLRQEMQSWLQRNQQNQQNQQTQQ